ncbi:MAG: hypothetical protein JXD22_11735 [Sedimentisphaerales bacterium]|nr:hypothetical protein [Sedimentisphaerales bacterium]
MDVLSKILKWLDHNRYLVIAFALAVVAMAGVVSMIGCESATMSLFNSDDGTPTAKVGRAEFNRQVITGEKNFAIKRIELEAQVTAFNEEVAAFNKQAEAGSEDLDRQDEFRQEIMNTVALVATQAAEGTLNPVSLIPLGIGIFGGFMGLGLAGDNRRKDGVITDLKANPPAVT